MPTYSLLSEAWSDPIMKQTQKGNFIVDSNLNNEEDDEQLKNNVPPNYSKLLNSSANNFNNLNDRNNRNDRNDRNDPNRDLLLNNNLNRSINRSPKLRQTVIEDFKVADNVKSYNNDEEDISDTEEDYRKTIRELNEHVKSLEKQIKSLKSETNYHINQTEQGVQSSLFGNVNTNELIVFGSIGIFTIMLVDSFTKIGMKLNSKNLL